MNEEVNEVVDEAEAEQENELTDDQSEQNENERTEESEDSEPETEDTNNEIEINETETNPVDDFEFEYDRNETVLLLNEYEESSELIQPILDVTFTTIFPYLVPLFFLFTVFIFSDQIIALIQNAIGSNGRRRR